jgi:peroxiredoxin
VLIRVKQVTALLCAIPLLLGMSAATIERGVDAETGLRSWEWREAGVVLRLVQRLPDQTRGFFLARGFSGGAADRIADACIFQTIFRNEGEQPLVYSLDDWRADRPALVAAAHPPAFRAGRLQLGHDRFRPAIGLGFRSRAGCEPRRRKADPHHRRHRLLAGPGGELSMRRFLVAALLVLFSLPSAAQQAGKGLTPLVDQPPAPDFSLVDMDGEVYRLSDLRGRVVIVNFWATWCPPCREEMPSMQRAWEQLEAEGIVMLGINVGEDEDTIFEFTANYPVDFPLLLDRDSKIIGQWPVRGLPTTYVVDPDGRLVYQAIGSREWDDPALLSLVRALQ